MATPKQLFLDQVYTLDGVELTGEEIRDRLLMFDKLSAFVESEHASDTLL